MESSLSFWERQSLIGSPELVVLGSGIVGLNAALTYLERFPKGKVLVLERGPLPSGASTKNAGFACIGSMTELLSDLQQMEPSALWDLVEARYRGLQGLRERLGDDTIHYEPLGGFELFRLEEQGLFETCLDRMEVFNQALGSITGLKETFTQASKRVEEFGFDQTKHLILNEAEGQLDTGRMMQALLQLVREKGATIINGVEVSAWEVNEHGVEIQTNCGWRIRTAYLLVATNAFTSRLIPGLELQAARNQVLITEPIPDLKVKGSFHYDQGYYYFRNVGNRILLGGGRHLAPETEMTDAFGTTPLIRQRLEGLLNEVILPCTKVHIDAWWSGILGTGPVKSPIVRTIENRVQLAVRLGGMGVAIGTEVGARAVRELMNW